ncbi:fungal-specific transcription factor domain-containing protein [Xylogone sp. PMI_703]|nr:fungal-specific transcription factor domain-containing protein [Xylogone sp. PMI_703]
MSIEQRTMTPWHSAPPLPQSPTKSHTKRRPGGTRQRTGCLTCRQRRKKCDGLYPICGHCTRLNLVCVRKEPQNIVDTALAAPVYCMTPGDSWTPSILRAPDPIDVCGYADSSRGIDQRFLLKYYTNVLSKLLTTNDENNSFLSVFLRMAIESRALLAAILAWSSVHMSRYDKRYESTAIRLQSFAISRLTLILGTSSTAQLDTALATCLILCCSDVDEGDTRRWYSHMKGARDIITSARLVESSGRVLTGPECYMTNSDGEWLLRNFAYHDVIASVTLDQPPLIQGAYWIRDECHIVDANVGIASQMFALISQISCLTGTDNGDKQSSDFDFIRQFLTLEKELISWTPPVNSHEFLVELAECHRCSALIHLYRQCRKRFPDGLEYIEQCIQTQVKATLTHVDRIPAISLPGCGVLFPLFMAGGEAVEGSDIQVIQTRLQLQQQHRAFGNIQRAIDVLQELWQMRAADLRGQDGRPVDWLDILQSKDWKLLLT